MAALLDPQALLEVMEGNRRLTLRTIEAFPEDALFNFRPVEAMRPFAEMVRESLDMEPITSAASPPASGAPRTVAPGCGPRRICGMPAGGCGSGPGSCGPA